jgi:hypothetical protein
MEPRPLGQPFRARDGVIGQLAQGLAAKARSADAKDHEVGGVGPQPRQGSLQRLQVVGAFGHLQQRKGPALVFGAQAGQRRLDGRDPGLDRLRGHPSHADFREGRKIDRLLNSHQALRCEIVGVGGG